MPWVVHLRGKIHGGLRRHSRPIMGDQFHWEWFFSLLGDNALPILKGCDIIPVQLPDRDKTMTAIGRRDYDGFMSKLNIAARRIVRTQEPAKSPPPVCLLFMQVGRGRVKIKGKDVAGEEAAKINTKEKHYVLIDDVPEESTYSTREAVDSVGDDMT